MKYRCNVCEIRCKLEMESSLKPIKCVVTPAVKPKFEVPKECCTCEHLVGDVSKCDDCDDKYSNHSVG